MHKKPMNIYIVDTKRIVLLFHERSYNEIFIWYDTYYDGVIPLYIKFHPMNALTKYYKSNKKMNCLAYERFN